MGSILKAKTSIYLADDHTILRDGLRVILEANEAYSIVGESSDGKIALEEIERKKPDIVILDISMPSMTGIEIARQIKKYNADIKVIMLSRHDNKMYIRKLLDIGINGYVLKENAADDLTRAIEAAQAGKVYLSPDITSQILSDLDEQVIDEEKATSEIYEKLTNRERQILKLLAEGNSNKEIATSLFISPATVKTHRINIMKKLDIHRLADLVKYAIQHGMVET